MLLNEKLYDRFIAQAQKTKISNVTLGLSYTPILHVAVKADYNIIETAAGTGVDQINVAVGFLF